MMRNIFLLVLCVAAASTRLLPHPPNFVPITALALFGAVYFDKKYAFILPVGALLLSDIFLGFYDGMAWVYGSFVLIGFLGFWLKTHKSILAVAGTTLVGSVLFFVVTNFGVWMSGILYMPNFTGLIQCYTAAIPFFRNSLIGDGFYVAVLFGITEAAFRYVPALALPVGGKQGR
jgi:hypothetical protein